MTSRLEAIFPEIERRFLEWPSRVFTERDIELLRVQHHEEWELPKSTTGGRFLSQLLHHAPLERVDLAFSRFRKVVYAWGEAPTLEVLGRMWPTAYFSHTVAAYLNGLVPAFPSTIFVNFEQDQASPEGAVLTQSGVDAAFKRPQRLPKQSAEMDGMRIYLSNGRNTWGIGLTRLPYKDQRTDRSILVRSTTLERTLIDMTVRPAHVGGPSVVLEAFRRASERLETSTLARMLNDLRFVYPYGRAIGFYLDQSGVYSCAAIQPFLDLPKDIDFYLAHGMEDSRYVSRWGLHVPLHL